MCQLSEYVDRRLYRYVVTLPAYLKDSGHLLSLLSEIEWKEGMLLVTLDVAALCSNIPPEKGIRAIREFLTIYPLMPPSQRQFLVDEFEFILKHIYFVFNGKYYFEQSGTVMDAKCTPVFPSLYIRSYEKSHILFIK